MPQHVDSKSLVTKRILNVERLCFTQKCYTDFVVFQLTTHLFAFAKLKIGMPTLNFIHTGTPVQKANFGKKNKTDEKNFKKGSSLYWRRASLNFECPERLILFSRESSTNHLVETSIYFYSMQQDESQSHVRREKYGLLESITLLKKLPVLEFS